MKINKDFRLFSACCLALALNLCVISSAYAETYSYDNAGRLTGITYDDGSSISYTYDARGNRLQLTVFSLTANIMVAPTAHDFGVVDVGSVSTSQTITINNIGSADLVITSIGLSGANAVEFDLATVSCANLSPTVSPASNCTVTVTFSPTSAGIKTASLDIASNDPVTPVINLLLSATAMAIANNPPDSFALVFPADSATGLPASLPLIWKQATDPDGDTLSYQVIFCDNAAFTGCSAQTVAVNTRDMILVASVAAPFGGLFMLGLVFSGSRKTRIKKQLAFIAILVFVSALAACGGGSSAPDDPVFPTAAADEKQLDISSLTPATTYYWKVTADDGNGGLTDSVTRNFTTQ